MKKQSIFVFSLLASIIVSCTKKDTVFKDQQLDNQLTERKSTANQNIAGESLANVMVTTLAGQGFHPDGSVDGVGSNAAFYSLSAMTKDNEGNLYVSGNSDGKIRKVTPSGVVTTLNFTKADPTETFRDVPNGLAIDGNNNFYITQNQQHLIRKINNGLISTLAGSIQGYENGYGTKAKFAAPINMVFDKSGNMYVVDNWNNRIRKVSPEGEVSTFAGSGQAATKDGRGESASFKDLYGITIDNEGNLYVTQRHSVRKINPYGIVTTIVDGGEESDDVDGAGPDVRFWSLKGITVDAAGNLYVVDNGYYTDKIKKITPDGYVTSLAGSGGWWNDVQDGPGATARFIFPLGITIDESGHTLYVTDDYYVRKITF